MTLVQVGLGDKYRVEAKRIYLSSIQEKEYGGWMIHAFRLLARLKFLRNTAFDPFGYTAERKAERKLIDDYLAMIEQHIAALKGGQISILARLARLPVKHFSMRQQTQQNGRAFRTRGGHRLCSA